MTETIKGLEILKLNKTIELLNEKYANNQLKPEIVEFLNEMCRIEIKAKNKNIQNSIVRVANFPSLKTLDNYEFNFQAELNEVKIRELAKLEFIERNENIVFIGSPGVGKTHLAIALGRISAEKRNSTYFIKCQKLINNLQKAYDENRLMQIIKNYSRYKLLIIDELGFLPLTSLQARMLFQLIDSRYEKHPTIITSNLTIDKWINVFQDTDLTGAIVDRIIHHSHLFNINGPSYRTKDKLETANS